MTVRNVPILAFNRGMISPKALARVDLDRLPFSGEIQRNWLPRTLGSMTLRPGLQYIGGTNSGNAAYFLPFSFATDDNALIELTAGAIRVWVDDALIVRPAVSAFIANSGFTNNVALWTDADETAAVSSWKTGGYLSLVGTGTDYAIRRQQVTVTEAGVEHALRIVVERGPVALKVGISSGDGTYFDTVLATGVHSLSFVPSADFWIDLKSNLLRETLVDSVSVEAAGTASLPSPYASSLSCVRYAQSADVLFLACNSHKQRRLERRSARSWSLVDYEALDGPFDIINTTSITITPSG